jgi:NAD(P)H-flavin reductase
MLSMFQMHSFVVSWWEEDDQGEEIISLLVKPRSGLTRQFGDRLREPNEYCVIIDSPYGPDRAGGMIRDVCDYGHILMIATGIGIAAQVPYIKELLDGQRKGIVRTQRITLVWELDLFRKSWATLQSSTKILQRSITE